MKLNEKMLKRTENVLMFDKKIKHNGFLSIFEKDLKNLLSVYFSMSDQGIKLKLAKGELGNLNLFISLENIKPKKVGINA